MRKPLLLLSAAVFLITTVIAQPNYTSTNYGSAGDSLFYSSVTLPSGTSGFAQSGANQTWNFSTLSPTTQFYEYFLNPTTAGYRGTFLAECIAGGGTGAACRSQFNSLTNLGFHELTNYRLPNYTFSNVVSHDLKSSGSLEVNFIGMTTKVGGANIPFTFNYINPDVVYVFPLSYGGRDSSESGYNIDLTSQGVNWVYHAHMKRVNHVDGWGSITTPYATYASTVRLRSTVLHTDTLFFNGTVIPEAAYTTVTYSWFDPSQKAPVFTASGTVSARGVETYTNVTYLDVIQCLNPTATPHINPLLPAIGSTGSALVNFTSTNASTNSFAWTFGDTASHSLNTSTASAPSHSYSQAGTYNCQLIACNTVCNPVRCDTINFNVKVVDSGTVHAAFTAKPSVTCVSDTVRFKNNSANATSYYWNFGDNITDTGTAPFHIYTTVGTYNVVLVAHNGITTDTARRTVTIEAVPSAVVVPNGPTSFCNGDSVKLAATGGTSYHWSTGSNNAQITVRHSGSYTVTVNNTCGAGISTPVVVTVSTMPDTVISLGTDTVCHGDTVYLQATTGTGLSYQWKRNNQVIVGATQSNLAATVSGNYTAVISQGICRATSNTATVLVRALTPATVTVRSGTSICAGDSVMLTANRGANLSYQWQVNNSNITGAVNDTFYAQAGGSYSVVVTRNSCPSTSNSIGVVVNPIPSPTIIMTGNAVCQGDSLLLSTQSGAGYSYQWMMNGSNIIGANSQTYYAGTQGIYSAQVTANGCSGVSADTSVTVNARPTADAGVNQNLLGCSLSLDTLGGAPSASGGTGPYRYLWTPTSGLSSDTISNPTVGGIGSSQTYALTVTDVNGCTASASATVTVTGASLSVQINATGSGVWCAGSGDSLVIDAVVSGGASPYTYSWTPGTGLSSIDSAHTVASPSAAGSYTYSLQVTDMNGCQTGGTASVTVNTQPIATIVANDTTSPCFGDSVSFSAATGAGYSYQWLQNGSPITGANNVNYTTTADGVYSVAVTTGLCNATSDTMTVAIRPMPSAVVTALSSLTFCSGGNAILAASSGNGYTYQWYENGQTINGASGDTLLAIDSASYYVEVMLNGCSAFSNIDTTAVNPYPSDTVNVSGITVFCAGGSVLLTGPSVAGYNYTWLNNDTVISGQTSSTLNVTTSGLYSLAVTAAGCSDTSLSVPVTVYQFPVNTLTAASNTTFCGGDSVMLSVPSGGTGTTYQWQTGGNDIIGAVSSSYTTMDSGSFNVIISQNGCTDTSNSISVTVNPLPFAGVTPIGPITLCGTDSAILTGPSGSGISYQWMNNNSNIPSATNLSYTVTAAGIYTLNVTQNGCTGLSNIVIVSANPIPSVSISPTGPLHICAHDTTVLTSTAGSGVTYQWQNNNVNIANAVNANLTASDSGTYTLQVMSGGCTGTSNGVVVTVSPLPVAAITPSSVRGLCTYDTVLLTAQSGIGYTYQWIDHSSNISGATAVRYTVRDSGSYSVKVTANNCSAISNTVSVHRFPNDTPVISRSGNTLTVTPAGTGYQWYNTSGAISGATHQSFTPASGGIYSVLITDSNGCLHLADTVHFTPVGISEVVGSASISVYPNPAHDYVSISVSASQSTYLSIKVYDVIGNEIGTVFEGNEAQGMVTHHFATSGLAKGVYLVRITDGLSTMTQRISIQ